MRPSLIANVNNYESFGPAYVASPRMIRVVGSLVLARTNWARQSAVIVSHDWKAAELQWLHVGAWDLKSHWAPLQWQGFSTS